MALCVPFGTKAHAKPVELEPYGGPLGREIDAAIQAATSGGFWGSILVQRGGKKVLEKGYGSSDYKGWPCTPFTPYEIASLSKQFTAAAVLKLEQDGKLKTSDTLERFFEDLPDDKKGIRVLHLLQHTSGLSDLIGVPYDSPMSRAQYVPHVLATPSTHEPGAHFAYNNAGYALLAAIVEVASGTSFEAYSHAALFNPARMRETGFIGEETLKKDKRVASRLGSEPMSTAADWHWGWGYRGMGGVVTNTLDLARWDRILRTDDVLAASAKEALYRPGPSGYACGWRVETTARGTTKVHHGGSVAGFSCYCSRYLEDDTLVVILTNNRKDLHSLAKLIEGKLFPSPELTVNLDVSGYTLGTSRMAELGSGATWVVDKGSAALTLHLKDAEGRTLVVVNLPPTYARKLITGLERGIAARARDDDGKPAAMEAGIYFRAYPPGSPKIELTEQLSINVMPQYQGVGEGGKRIVDKRVVFVVQDAKHRMWPVIVKMNVAAAKELLGQLK